MSTIHFIGGEKGGVGKSVVARLVAQYCIDKSIPFTGVDADASHGALMRYYGDYTRAVDLHEPTSIDVVLELATETERRVVVDLPAQSDRALSAWIAEAGVFELARESNVRIVLWHVLDDGKDAINTLDRLLERHGSAARYCVVKNLGREEDFSLFDGSKARNHALALGATILDLPALQEAAMRKIDRLDASFWAAIHNPNLGGDALTRIDRQRIKVWLQSSFDAIAREPDLI